MSMPMPVPDQKIEPALAGDTAEARRKRRVAIGVFDRADKLFQAMSLLSDGNDSNAALMLMGEGAALGGCLAQAASNWPHVKLISQKLISQGGPSAPGAPTRSWLDGLADLESWLAPRLAERLRRSMAQGACLLFLCAEPPVLEQRVCDLLIRHCSGPVQVHDVEL